jgi:hypothetical protein
MNLVFADTAGKDCRSLGSAGDREFVEKVSEEAACFVCMPATRVRSPASHYDHDIAGHQTQQENGDDGSLVQHIYSHVPLRRLRLPSF